MSLYGAGPAHVKWFRVQGHGLHPLNKTDRTLQSPPCSPGFPFSWLKNLHWMSLPPGIFSSIRQKSPSPCTAYQSKGLPVFSRSLRTVSRETPIFFFRIYILIACLSVHQAYYLFDNGTPANPQTLLSVCFCFHLCFAGCELDYFTCKYITSFNLFFLLQTPQINLFIFVYIPQNSACFNFILA